MNNEDSNISVFFKAIAFLVISIAIGFVFWLLYISIFAALVPKYQWLNILFSALSILLGGIALVIFLRLILRKIHINLPITIASLLLSVQIGVGVYFLCNVFNPEIWQGQMWKDAPFFLISIGAALIILTLLLSFKPKQKFERFVAGFSFFVISAEAAIGFFSILFHIADAIAKFSGTTVNPWLNITFFLIAIVVCNVIFAFLSYFTMNLHFKERLSKAFIYEIFLVYFVIVAFPFVWVFYTSFKPSKDVFEDPFALPRLQYQEEVKDTVQPPEETGASELAVAGETSTSEQTNDQAEAHPETQTSTAASVQDDGQKGSEAQTAKGKKTKTVTIWDNMYKNYNKAWVESKFSYQFFNSIFVVVISLIGSLVISSMTAYILARFEFKFNRLILYLFLAGLMVPMQLGLIPLFFQYSYFGKFLTAAFRPIMDAIGMQDYYISLFDSRIGLAIIYIATSLPFTIFILVGFFRTIPSQMREAAIIDGCSEFQAFWHVMAPLAKPGLLTVAIFNFLGFWNEYLYALTFINSDTLKTIPLGLANMSITAQYRVDYGLLFAGLVILMVPTLIVYMLLQKRLTKGITMGALKA